MQIHELSDTAIIKRMQELSSGNPGSDSVEKQYAEEIYNRYYKQAYYLSRYYGLSHNDAEDAAQEAFIKLFRNIRSFHSDKPFKPWFLKMVLNKVRDRYGDLKKAKYRDIDDMSDCPEVHDNHPHEQLMEEFHVREYIGGIINRLPKKLKNVVILRIYGEMKFEEIAKSEGISVRQVRNRLEGAYALIRESLEAGTWRV